MVVLTRSGQRRVWKYRNVLKKTSEGKPYVLGVAQDVTHEMELEKALVLKEREFQAELKRGQRVEALTLLAGGLSHDFNNVLTGIVGAAEQMLRQLEPDHRARVNAERILSCGMRGASLALQLLTLSRQEDIQQGVVDLHSFLATAHGWLTHIIGEGIELKMNLQAEPMPILANPSLIERILINLVGNALNAMPEGGTLTIGARTGKHFLSKAKSDRFTPERPAVILTVQDTGSGMDESTMSRIFEPFFTTKPKGQSSGLGLTVVKALVYEFEGEIAVRSAVGTGTTFEITFPKNEQVSIKSQDNSERAEQKRRSIILVVEDDPTVLEVTCELLREGGYVVYGALTHIESLRIHNEHPGRFDLLISDVVLPHMPGPELAECLKSLNPKMKVIFMSAFDHEATSRFGLRAEDSVVLRKPFTQDCLLRTVQSVLGPREGPGATSSPSPLGHAQSYDSSLTTGPLLLF